MTQVDGLVPVEGATEPQIRRLGRGGVDMRISPAGTDARGLEVMDAALTGKVAADGGSVSFRLTGTARAAAAGAAVELLGGGAALADGVAGDGWHVALRKNGRGLGL